MKTTTGLTAALLGIDRLACKTSVHRPTYSQVVVAPFHRPQSVCHCDLRTH